jgi:hypothetical protein
MTGANPFKRSTHLRYTLPASQQVRVDVFSVSGQRLRTLVDAKQPAGEHLVTLSLGRGNDGLPAGVYMVRLTSGSYSRTLRVVGIE